MQCNINDNNHYNNFKNIYTILEKYSVAGHLVWLNWLLKEDYTFGSGWYFSGMVCHVVARLVDIPDSFPLENASIFPEARRKLERHAGA